MRQITEDKQKLNNMYTLCIHGMYSGKLNTNPQNGPSHHLKYYLQLKMKKDVGGWWDYLWKVIRRNIVRWLCEVNSGMFFIDRTFLWFRAILPLPSREREICFKMEISLISINLYKSLQKVKYCCVFRVSPVSPFSQKLSAQKNPLHQRGIFWGGIVCNLSYDISISYIFYICKFIINT